MKGMFHRHAPYATPLTEQVERITFSLTGEFPAISKSLVDRWRAPVTGPRTPAGSEAVNRSVTAPSSPAGTTSGPPFWTTVPTSAAVVTAAGVAGAAKATDPPSVTGAGAAINAAAAITAVRIRATKSSSAPGCGGTWC
ncbi:hypothetical protein STANM309S_03830 [Streptomyces tanashiensis]